MYAFLCMPGYAPLQWHPFTICSGNEDTTVDFLIAGVGDWTRELARSCLEAKEKGSPLPKMALDGPFMAPTQSALTKKVLVAVGAGVGITPFLSLMSTIITQLDSDGDLPGSSSLGKGNKFAQFSRLVEVHFFWMTRNADEFLFARTQISRIATHRNLVDKVFIHLHVTGKAPDKDASGYLFREALRRQNEIDRKVFRQLLDERGLLRLVGPSLPMCWVNGAREDLMWAKGLAVPSHKLRAEREQLKSTLIAHHTEGTSVIVSDFKREISAGSVDEDLGMLSAGGEDFFLVPVIFGRPDFATEIRSIGKARPGYNVHIYACANDLVVQGLQDVAEVCNQHAFADTQANDTLPQKYMLHFERFG
jgi:NAD(P)H-flavin reductase